MSRRPVYWDPFDRQIAADPVPIYERMRSETPLYYNNRHHFYALSRADDVLRDERRWPDGERFDIHRKIGQQLTFGFGTHYCLGNALARLEARVALEEFLPRFPKWEVDWDGAELSSTSTMRGWETLPITVG
jgi:cytochrome P450